MLGSYAMFPQSETRRIDPAYYDDQRTPTRDAATPYLQSITIAGPYLELIVPTDPASTIPPCAVRARMRMEHRRRHDEPMFALPACRHCAQ